MKISKIFAGMSALALAASMSVCASAAEAPTENQFYNATGEWKYTFSGADLKAAVDDGGAQFTANDDGTYVFGCNIQVGHMKNAKVTLEVESTKNNIYNGADADAVNSTYMYTVQASWNGDAPADKEKTPVKFMFNEDGSAVEKKGATDLNNWDSGATKFNGQWAQFIMTDDDLDAITINATIVADGDTTWEYHPIDPDAEENVYITFNFMGSPNTVTEKVDSAEINAQIEGDDASAGEGEAAEGGESEGGEAVSGGDEKSSSGDGDSAGATGGEAAGTTGGSNGGSTGGSTAGGSDSNGNAGTGSGSAAATTNTSTGSSAGLALAGLALAGAALVATKKR